jgi:heme-degrading monooxygenase HmoA
VHVHLTLMTFDDPAVLDDLEPRMRSMEGRVPGLVGLTVTRTERDDDTSAHVGLTTRFVDAAAYEAYRTDAVHMEVAAHVRARMTGAMTLDWTE